MAAACNLRLDRSRLQTVFHDDGASVVHTRSRTNVFSTGQTKITVKTRWTDKKVLGSGGFGCVTLQEDDEGHLRAVKRLFHAKPEGINYCRELKALSKVSDRSDLFVRFLGWYENNHSLFIAMEFVEHGDLGQYMKSEDARLESNTREAIRQVLEGLAVLHDKNICHRDLKPQNILVASRNPISVKIADFGASKHLDGTQLRSLVGTPGYLAPELLGLYKPRCGRRAYSKAVDLWALGCIIYQMFTLQIPFTLRITSQSAATDISGLDSELDPLLPQTDIALLQGFCLGEIQLPTEGLHNAHANPHAIALIQNLLLADPEIRLSASIALKSSWFTENNPLRPQFDASGPSRSQQRNPIPVQAGTERDLDVYFLLNPEETSNMLLDAADRGASEMVATLLDSGADTEGKDSLGRTPLLKAAGNGHIETVGLLLDCGADVHAKDSSGATALLLTAHHGHSHVVRVLLDHGAHIAAKDSFNSSALLHAADDGHTGTANLLLIRGAVVDDQDNFDRTALIIAVVNGHTSLVSTLLAHGAKLEERDILGRSALLNAAIYRQTGILRTLLDGGADLNTKDNQNNTALGLAAYYGHTAVAQLLLDRDAPKEEKNYLGRTALLNAAMNGQLEILRLLLKRAANLEAKDYNEATALVLAAYCGHTEAVDFLLDRGANMHEKDVFGREALLNATYKGHTETADTIRRRAVFLELASGTDMNTLPPSYEEVDSGVFHNLPEGRRTNIWVVMKFRALAGRRGR